MSIIYDFDFRIGGQDEGHAQEGEHPLLGPGHPKRDPRQAGRLRVDVRPGYRPELGRSFRGVFRHRQVAPHILYDASILKRHTQKIDIT